MKNDNWKANGDKRKGIIKCEKKKIELSEKKSERERSSTIYWMNH